MVMAAERRRFGRSGIEVTALGFGAATIGNLFRPVPEETAQAMFLAAWEQGVRLFDTAPSYGNGASEYRVGGFLRGRPRAEYVLSTKVGYLLRPDPAVNRVGPWAETGPFEAVFDYSFDGVMRSIEDSLQRLGVGRIDIAFIHDTDPYIMGDLWRERFEAALVGAVPALTELRDQGVIAGFGFGVNHWEVCYEAAQRADLDCFLLAGRYTLLDQEVLDDFLPLCERRDIAIMLGGGYNSGILATGAVPGAKYNYAPAPSDIMTRVARMEQVCARHGIPLAAAALQFPIAHPAVPTIIPGGRTVEQFLGSVDLVSQAIPPDFWAEMRAEKLIREDAPTPA